MVVGWSIRIYKIYIREFLYSVSEGRHTRCNIPSGRKNKQIRQGRIRVPRFSRQHAEDGWVDVVDGDGADVDEFG